MLEMVVPSVRLMRFGGTTMVTTARSKQPFVNITLRESVAQRCGAIF